MKTELRYGIIGAGSMGREHIENIKVMGGAAVTAISDPHVPSQEAALAMAPGAKVPGITFATASAAALERSSRGKIIT